MRRGFGLIGLLVTAILVVIVGAIAYNIGYSDGVATHLPAVANGDVAPAYYYGYHGFGDGFGFFGILWFLLILFGIFWLLRLAFFGFWGRRMWRGGGGWGYGRGFGPGGGGQGRWGSFEERAQEWHRKQHGDQPPASEQTPPPPPTDTRSV